MKTSRDWWKRAVSAASLAFVALAAPSSATGQAICSAPHSSPTLLQGAGNRTLPTGAGWIQLSTAYNRAGESFNPFGDRQGFLAESVFRTRSAYLTAAYGLVRGLELWGQIPVHNLGTEATNGSSSKTGLGDLRMAVRLSPALFGLEAPVAVRVGYKMPGADFPVDATELPLTEGQDDFEVSIESGLQGDRLPVFIAGWVGHRWRSENVAAGHRPGDETFAHLAVGGSAGRVGWQLGVDALWGGVPTDQGLRLVGQKRRMVQIVPSLATRAGPGTLEASAPVPVSGRNLPAGYTLSVGYRWAWGQ